MAPVEFNSFGQQLNFEDDNDPVIRRFRVLGASPCPVDQQVFENARYYNWPRSGVLEELRWHDQHMASMGHIPGTGPYLHRQWLEQLTSYDPETHTFDPEEAREVAERVKAETEHLLQERQRRATARVLKFKPRSEAS